MINTLERAKDWAQNPYFDAESRNEIQELIDQNNLKEIEERFYRDLEFGTGGIRAILGQGSFRLNKYNIRKATQAVALAILSSKPDRPKVAISYDSRKYSFEFAKEAAGVFAANGIKALIYNRLNPVPLCSFAIRYHNCNAGVMVTASHNPPEYNGFKVFWSDGAQVTPPNDKNIINHFNNISDFSTISFMEFDQGIKENLIEWLDEETENIYFEAIKSKSLNPEMTVNNGKDLKIVYTALHGTGLIPCTKALNDLGMNNILLVEEQKDPNQDFPTVSSPNPENPEALSMAVNLMKKEGADLCLGTDPDTDRVGIALEHEGRTQYLNGNQIGILMLHYILTNLKEQNKIPDNSYIVKTIVTTNLLNNIAKDYGVKVENTLTGFKWICGKVKELQEQDPTLNFLFGTEESFGYLSHDFVRDKDGVSSVALMCEIALFYKLKGQNLFEALDNIYDKYGFSFESLLCLDYYGKEGAQKISQIMEYFRNFDEPQIAGMKVLEKEDYQSKIIRNLSSNTERSIELPPSNVLGFKLENGNSIYLRPSGTEPKIKFYIGIQENSGDLATKKTKADKLTKIVLKYIENIADQI